MQKIVRLGFLNYVTVNVTLNGPGCKLQEARLLLCSSRRSETCGTEENGRQQSFAVRGLVTKKKLRISQNLEPFPMDRWGKSTDLGKFVINICAIIMVQCIAFCERVSCPQFAAYIRVTEARWHARTRIYKHYVCKACSGWVISPNVSLRLVEGSWRIIV